jgi:hypothetical protein
MHGGLRLKDLVSGTGYRILKFFKDIAQNEEIQSNPVITTSVYATPLLKRQIFCGTNKFLTVNHDIILLGYNDTRL